MCVQYYFLRHCRQDSHAKVLEPLHAASQQHQFLSRFPRVVQALDFGRLSRLRSRELGQHYGCVCCELSHGWWVDPTDDWLEGY
jgi:hypothetical protein